jgi:hypothetical protein
VLGLASAPGQAGQQAGGAETPMNGEFTFKLRPSTEGQLQAFHALDELDGYDVAKNEDGYHHVTVWAPSFDEAQIRLRDMLAELEPPQQGVGVLLKKVDSD